MYVHTTAFISEFQTFLEIINLDYSGLLWFHHQFCVTKMLLMNIELQRIAKRQRHRVYLWISHVLEFQFCKSKIMFILFLTEEA